MAQLRVVSFHRVRLRFVVHARMLTPPAEFSIGEKGIRKVMCSMWRSINDGLHHFWRAVLADRVRDNAARLSVNERDDKRWLFLVPTKVNNSSISRVWELFGTGAAAFFVFICA